MLSRAPQLAPISEVSFWDELSPDRCIGYTWAAKNPGATVNGTWYSWEGDLSADCCAKGLFIPAIPRHGLLCVVPVPQRSELSAAAGIPLAHLDQRSLLSRHFGGF